MQHTIVRSADDLEALAGEWSELLASSASSEPTQSPAWLLSWWSVFGETGGRVLRVLVFRDAARLVGVVPLLARRARYRRAIPFRRLEFMGSGEDEADEIVSDYMGAIVAKGWERRVATALARALVSGGLGRWDELVCPRMDGTAPMTDALIAALAAERVTCTLDQRTSCPYIELPTTWEGYLGALSSSRRYKVRRSLRELESWSGGEWALHRVATHAELTEGLAVLMRLHAKRWGTEGRRGVFASPSFRRFHERVTADFLQLGALDLCWLSVRGEPVAASYSIEWEGSIHFYQSGRETEVPTKVTPGIALHALLIQRAINRGLREYDFLSGDARYKTMLATHTRRLVSLRVTPFASAREAARELVESGVDLVRGTQKRLRPPDPADG